MRLSDISIKNPVMAWMIMLAILVFGVISFNRMGISQYPDIDYPTINVSVSLLGASPEVMEQNVITPIEDALTSLEGVSGIYSTSRSGSANVSIEFELERNIDAAIQEVSTRVGQIQRRLPKDIDPPVISKMNPEDSAIVWISVQSKSGNLRELMKFTQEFVKDQFTDLHGVGDVILGGFADPIIGVKLKPERLKKHNITVTDVMDAIQSEHVDTNGGQINDTQNTFNITVKGEAQSLEELKKISIAKRAGQYTSDLTRSLRLSDVADISLTLADNASISRFNKNVSVSVGVKKQRGVNAVEVAEAVIKRVDELQSKIPDDYNINLSFDTTKFIKNSIHELNQHLLMAVILTALVCLLFLGSWSATFNVLLSIPTSLFGAFTVLYFLNYTLNTFTLLGLTLSIGIVVDDAIMVLENIFRHKEKKKGQIHSAIIGAREITFAAIAATAAVVAIFLPVVFMKGVIGRFFMQFGVAISVAVIFSLIESLTITPMRSALYVQEGHRTTRIGRAFEYLFKKTEELYLKLLRPSLNHKTFVIVGSLFLVCVSFYSIRFLKSEFLPPQDSGMMSVRVQMPIGTSLEATNTAATKMEDWLREQPDINNVAVSIGSGFGSGRDVSRANFMISLKSKKECARSQVEISNDIRKNLSKMTTGRVNISDPSTRAFGGGGRGSPVEFVVKGTDWPTLQKAVQDIMDKMKSSDLMTDIDSNLDEGLPEIQIVPNRQSMTVSGVNVSNLGAVVATMMNGKTVAQYTEGGKRYDVVLSLEKTKNQIHDLENIFVSNVKGNFLPINRLVKYENTKTLQQINHVNRFRAISVYANVEKQVSPDKAWSYIQAESKKILKPGYIIEKSGTTQAQAETFQSLLFALLLGVLVAYMIIAAQYNSFIDPVTILIALPYSVGGALIGLIITQQSLNMYSFIGIVLLMGIVKKNSILLVDFANQEIRKNRSMKALEAIMDSAQSRFRPIVMTSIATIMAAVPVAVATGEGAETTRSMAITIIFGVFFSTLLTLFVVPSLYVFFNRFKTQNNVEQEIATAFKDVGNTGL